MTGRMGTKRGLQAAAIVLAAVLVGWFAFGGKGEVGSVAAETTDTVQNTITVGADGSIQVEPDVAYVTFAVETRGKTAQEAQQANADKFAAVEKTLYETFAIEKKDVQTTGFNVQPEYNYTEKDGQVLKGYVADHELKVTYRKLADIGKLLDALSTAGANRMYGVTFGTEKQDQYELEALKKAMANADAKAGVLASSAKRQLGNVINIVQGNAASIPIVQTAAESKAMFDTAAKSPATSVQSGQIEIKVSVTVQYAMK
jgi:uncharacterized protein YggE